MIATKQMDVRANIKKYFDMAFNGEPVIVSRKENKNVVIISEAEYNDLAKARKNAEYLAKLNRADEQIKNGQVITKTMDELFKDDEDVLGDLPVGMLSRYVDPEKRLLEEGAFERAMVEKHGNG